MPLYSFQKQNGQQFDMIFSINNVPNEIVLQDGSIAKRKISCPYLSGTSQTWQKIKKQQTNKNIQAGKRGHAYWSKKVKEL